MSLRGSMDCSANKCNVCFADDRTLGRVAKYDEQQYVHKILESPSNMWLCWECIHQVRRGAAFAKRVLRSQVLLIDNAGILAPASRLSVSKTATVDIDPDIPTESVQIQESHIKVESPKLLEIDICPMKYTDDKDLLCERNIKAESDDELCNTQNIFPSDDSDDLAELESQVKAFVDGGEPKVKKKKKKDKASRRKEKKLKSKQGKREERTDGMRVIELSVDEMNAERETAAGKPEFRAADYKCDSCVVAFEYGKNYREHMKLKHNSNKGDYSCPVCSSVSSTLQSLMSHYRRHLRRYECVECGQRTTEKKVMAQHVESTHVASVNKEFKCPCGKISNSLDAHRYHRDTHGPRVECDKCDKTFRHRAGLMNHTLSVHKFKNSFPCAVCSKVFKWKASLKKHMDRHNNKAMPQSEVPYCTPCGVSFSSACTYQRHLRSSLKHVSESQLKFVCDHCNRKYSNKTKLRDHIEEKHLHKTYQCHICNKPSKNRVCLDQHVRNVHRGRPHNKMCHHCGKGFPTKVQLESHIRSHTGERPFICELCPTTFSQQSNLYKHNRQVHMNMKSKKPQLDRRKGDPIAIEDTPSALLNTYHILV